MEPFVVTFTGYTVFATSLILASGALAAIRFNNEHLTTNRKPYVWVLVASTVVGTVSIANTGAVKETRLRSQLFTQHCQSAHITINRKVSGVRDVYFSSDSGCPDKLSGSFLYWCEQPAYRIDVEPDKPYQRVYGGGTRIVERLKEPQSEYAVVVKGITTDLDRQLGIAGGEKTVLNRVTGEVLATARWYRLTKHPYQTCPTTGIGISHLEGYVLDFLPLGALKRIESEIEQVRRERGGK